MLHIVCALIAVWFFAMGCINAAKGHTQLAAWCMIVFTISSIVALT